ncbi:unnamed protein product [Linum trigynum]|uniref:Uncharacterized protein n=1 Tax=Linum trigynum TaxID=586398 RepID=A0AAV2CHU4_9ROSI
MYPPSKVLCPAFRLPSRFSAPRLCFQYGPLQRRRPTSLNQLWRRFHWQRSPAPIVDRNVRQSLADTNYLVTAETSVNNVLCISDGRSLPLDSLPSSVACLHSRSLHSRRA